MSRIKKIKIKKTGQEISVIKQAGGNQVAVDLLQDAINIVRNGKVTAVGVFIKDESGHNTHYWTDYTGDYDALSAGAGHLQHRINKQWDET